MPCKELTPFPSTQLGAKVVLVARRKERLDEVAKECRELGAADVLVVPTDVCKEEEVDKLFSKTSDWLDGSLDCVVLNAGISDASFFKEYKDMSKCRSIMEINYFAAVYGTMKSLPLLKRSPNAVLAVVSSPAGLLGLPGRSLYSGSKSALSGFYNAIRRELMIENVNCGVTMIYPPAVNTEISMHHNSTLKFDEKKALSSEQCSEIIVKAIASKKREERFMPILSFAGVIGDLVPNIGDRILLMKMKAMGYMK